MSGSRTRRIRTIAGAALVASLGGAVLVGCGKHSMSIPTRPPAVHYDPDLTASDAYLYWGPGVPIGGPMGARGARLAEATGATQVASDANILVLGTPATPAFRVVTQGVSGWYMTHFYINEQLWWRVGGPAPNIPVGVVDHYGKEWVPADTGVYVLRMVVDPDSLVAEVDEANNEARLEVTVVPPDLRCWIRPFIQWRDGYPREVDEVQVNTPVDIVTMTVTDGSYQDYREVLNACGTVLRDRRTSMTGRMFYASWRFDTLQFTPTTTGACQVRFDVDPDGEKMMDRDRSDNTHSRTLTVRP